MTRIGPRVSKLQGKLHTKQITVHIQQSASQRDFKQSTSKRVIVNVYHIKLRKPWHKTNQRPILGEEKLKTEEPAKKFKHSQELWAFRLALALSQFHAEFWEAESRLIRAFYRWVWQRGQGHGRTRKTGSKRRWVGQDQREGGVGERGDNIYMYSDPHSPPNTHAKKDLPKKKINKIQSFQMHFLKRRSDIYKKIRQGRSSFHTRAYIYRITVSKYLRWGGVGGGEVIYMERRLPLIQAPSSRFSQEVGHFIRGATV